MCFSSFLLSFIDAVWVSGSWNWIAWLSDLTHHLGITSVFARAPDESIIFTDLRGNWLNHWRALSPTLMQRFQIRKLANPLGGAFLIECQIATYSQLCGQLTRRKSASLWN